MIIALPMMFGKISQIIMNRTDVLMLGAMSNMETVGIYSAANRFSTIITFVLGSINIIAAPMLATAYHNADTDQFRVIIRKGMLWSIWGALPLFAIIIIWPQVLLGFFGTEFVQGAVLLKVLAFGQLLNAVTGPVGFALLMAGTERQFAFTVSVVAVGNVIGNLIAIPIWGALGAAWVTAASLITLNGWQFFLSNKICKNPR
jgi:O-antigen/teichoic acid export membrane protein